jgi:hypothetical protein
VVEAVGTEVAVFTPGVADFTVADLVSAVT